MGSTTRVDNWKGATDYPQDVKKYIKNEIDFKSVLGPFKTNPFKQQACYSPLNARPKKDSDKCRIILDLSFPYGNSINDGIDKNKFLGDDIEL